MKRILLSAILLYSLIPVLVSAAGLSISEIMYDADGTDSGREWIEIYNDTGSNIDITQYKLTEGTSSHNINKISGDGNVPNKSYVIIAENPETFSADFPNVKKEAIYDASFSLSNGVGEMLSLKDSTGEIIFSVTYDTTIGANGDGQTLQYDGSHWVVGAPTPLESFGSSTNTNNSSSNTENTSSVSSSVSSSTVPKKEPTMKFVFEGPKNVIVSQQNEFKATLYGYNGEVINNGKFVWNFGDGTTLEQTNLAPVTHVYAYTGTYIISCSYKYNWMNKNIFVGKMVLSVVSSPFVIDEFYKFPFPALKITNTSNAEYDLFGYKIQSNLGDFLIQENTYIGGKDEIVMRLPTGEYDENSVRLVDGFNNTISQFKSVDPIEVVKQVPDIYIEKNPRVLGVDTQNDTIKEPVLKNKVIELEKDSGDTDNKLTYVLFVFVILVSGATVFLLYKNTRNTTDLEDEYTLQDE